MPLINILILGFLSDKLLIKCSHRFANQRWKSIKHLHNNIFNTNFINKFIIIQSIQIIIICIDNTNELIIINLLCLKEFLNSSSVIDADSTFINRWWITVPSCCLSSSTVALSNERSGMNLEKKSVFWSFCFHGPNNSPSSLREYCIKWQKHQDNKSSISGKCTQMSWSLCASDFELSLHEWVGWKTAECAVQLCIYAYQAAPKGGWICWNWLRHRKTGDEEMWHFVHYFNWPFLHCPNCKMVLTGRYRKQVLLLQVQKRGLRGKSCLFCKRFNKGTLWHAAKDDHIHEYTQHYKCESRK